MNEDSLFARLTIASDEERREILERECAGDSQLRTRLEQRL